MSDIKVAVRVKMPIRFEGGFNFFMSQTLFNYQRVLSHAYKQRCVRVAKVMEVDFPFMLQ
jgi:hypothetical protein